CWGYSAALASPEASGLTTVTGNNGVLLQGQADMVALSAPGAGNTGTVRINYAAPVFLQDDFYNIGVLENPSGLCTVRIFRGHGRVIYWREVGRLSVVPVVVLVIVVVTSAIHIQLFDFPGQGITA